MLTLQLPGHAVQWWHATVAGGELSERHALRDVNGSATIFFDAAGRLAADLVADLGSSGLVDDTVLRIGTTYDNIGRVQTVTSYADTSGTVAVNQVQYEYNGWGRVYREYQEHTGAVDANSPFVQYDYGDGASGGVARYVRLENTAYPSGREVHYGYGAIGAIDDIMSRLATIGDDTDIFASYKYLGAGRIVTEDYEEIGVRLDYAHDNLAGFDRFGRVVDQLWERYGDDPDVLDRYTYTYDRAGNRTSRTNALNHDFDESYLYDLADRLSSSQRADDYDQSWGLDGLGNFSAFDDDGDSQTRTVNEANEIESITGGWMSPSYDATGNLISGPKPGDGATRVHYVYDAWNRLVGVHADDSQNPGEPGDVVAQYGYDGRNRRMSKTLADGTGADYFYNHDWQLLEERFVDEQEELLASNEYVWSARYIDAPIVRFHDGNGDGDYLDAEDDIRYYAGDANYNVTATIDAATGEVVDRYVYTAYGTATVYDSDWSNPATPATDAPLYAGYFFDAETALYHVRNRYYDSALSTFISRDPFDARDDFNLYRYVGSNPIVFVDPTGELRSSSAWGSALAETDSRASQAMDLLKKLQGWLDVIPCKCELAVSGIPSIIDSLLIPNRPSGKPQWPWQHCASNCMMVAMCGGDQQSEQCAAWLSLAKEVLDVVACILIDQGRGDSCDSAFQPSDFQDNAAGRDFGRCCAAAGDRVAAAACCAAACAPGRYNAPEGPDTPRPWGPFNPDDPGDWPTWRDIIDDLW